METLFHLFPVEIRVFLLTELLMRIICRIAPTLPHLFFPGDDSEKKFKSDKYHTTGKRKKKKRRRKAEDSSDSDTECASTQRDSKLGQRLSPRLAVELPDIIPKQVNSYKNKVKLFDITYKFSLIDLN